MQEGSPEDLQLHADEALVYDALGKYDQATSSLTKLLDQLSHPDGKYNDQEKQSRAFLLDRLGMIYRERTRPLKPSTPTSSSSTSAETTRGMAADRRLPRHPPVERGRTSCRCSCQSAAERWRFQIVYAQQLADLGQVDQALSLAKSQLTNTPTDLDVHERLAEMYIRSEAVQ